MLTDTIAAISTPFGEGGIGIVRISGKDAFLILQKIFSPKNPKNWHKVESHTIHLGNIMDDSGNIVDEVLISIMKEPKTFTAENVVEINCHGGLIPLRKTLELVLNAGARLAEPGEFSKRAFLNGRIDLTQAEAIIDVIRAKTDSGLKMALSQLKGHLWEKIHNVRHEILGLMAKIEVSIDFPEEDLEEITLSEIRDKVSVMKEEIEALIKTADQGKFIREGINTVIIGRANVGKSSLLNALLKENRAIVTDIPGTTRDTIEEFINIGGFPLKIIDTAGIRETENIVEKIGVEKTRKIMEIADLILFVIDASMGFTEDDKELLNLLKGKKALVIINKIDLINNRKIEHDFEVMLDKTPYLFISAKENIGIDQLEKMIGEIIFEGKIKVSTDNIIINMRHKEKLMKAAKHLNEVLISQNLGMSIDFYSIDLKASWEALGEIIGENTGEDLLDRIFSDFCIGK